MENLSYDFLADSDIYVYQRKDMFRINTDTSLLAKFMTIKKGECVLDVGTNNGALLLAANRKQPSFMYGIDIQEEAIELARYNMQQQHIENVELICEDFKTASLPKVQVILCNPPYFKIHDGANLNESETLRKARHETYLELSQLCQKVSSLLDEKGRFYLVHRANRIAEIICELRKNRLEIRTLQFVYDEQKEEAITVLIEAVKDGKVNAHVANGIYVKR